MSIQEEILRILKSDDQTMQLDELVKKLSADRRKIGAPEVRAALIPLLLAKKVSKASNDSISVVRDRELQGSATR